MLDVERFDLEPERPLFHGNLNEEGIDFTKLKNLTSQEKLPMLDAMVNLSALSDRMKYSLSEMGKVSTPGRSWLLQWCWEVQWLLTPAEGSCCQKLIVPEDIMSILRN
ncbi:hypothetical protein LWM68_41715 [Niabella sp. W65]|nr:hypothetical protein [Niabella sp. W65]MCH7368685.1 hypothetical protein [Niabella sp. W65]